MMADAVCEYEDCNVEVFCVQPQLGKIFACPKCHRGHWVDDDDVYHEFVPPGMRCYVYENLTEYVGENKYASEPEPQKVTIRHLTTKRQ